MSNGLQDWDDMDEREWEEMERETDEEAQMSDMLEREQQCEEAIREALTRGVSLKNIRTLCSECGISYERVVGV